MTTTITLSSVPFFSAANTSALEATFARHSLALAGTPFSKFALIASCHTARDSDEQSLSCKRGARCMVATLVYTGTVISSWGKSPSVTVTALSSNHKPAAIECLSCPTHYWPADAALSSARCVQASCAMRNRCPFVRRAEKAHTWAMSTAC